MLSKATAKFLRVTGLLLLSGLGACSGPSIDRLRSPVPAALVNSAEPAGYSHIRAWGDDAESFREAIAKSGHLATLSSKPNADRTALALSGGGSDGAFGAGVLYGWTKAGGRPEFDVVTGISTGALIAPFAFLGPDYDEQLKTAFTEITGRNIFVRRNLLTVFGADSLTDNAPMINLVRSYVTEDMVSNIAKEHRKGRRLLIGTTNLDAERPVIWDIGAIAASNVTGRTELIKNVIVASAAIPAIFPPVRINVTADGQTFDELHVDGGTSNQVFLFPPNLSLSSLDRAAGRKGERRLYVIRNGKVTPEYSAVKPRLVPILTKSVNALIKTQGNGDLYRLYSLSEREGIEFKATWIPASFDKVEREPFDQSYMRALFQTGYDIGRRGVQWETQPP